MKHLLKLLLLLPLAFTSCKEEENKEEDNGPKLSPQETILTSHKWNEIAFKSTNAQGVVNTDIKVTDACLQDDVITFDKDGSYIFEPGVQCSFNVNPYDGTWKIVDNKFTSTRNPSTQEYEVVIEELTDKKFVTSTEFNGFKQVHTYRAL